MLLQQGSGGGENGPPNAILGFFTLISYARDRASIFVQTPTLNPSPQGGGRFWKNS